MQFTTPLPIAAVLTFVFGGMYKVYKFKQVTKKISASKADVIHQAYRNYLLLKAVGHKHTYNSLDPDGEMESLSKNLVVKLYSRKNANLIYARIQDCLAKNRFMLNNIAINENLYKSKYFTVNYLNNTLLYFFFIDILQLGNKEREIEFDKFSENINYLYDSENGYFKQYTTLDYVSNVSTEVSTI